MYVFSTVSDTRGRGRHERHFLNGSTLAIGLSKIFELSTELPPL